MSRAYNASVTLRVVVCASLAAIAFLATPVTSTAQTPPSGDTGKKGKNCQNNFVSRGKGNERGKELIEPKDRPDVPNEDSEAGTKKINQELAKMKKKNKNATWKQARDKLVYEDKKLCVDNEKECQNGGSLRYRDAEGDSVLLCTDQCKKEICGKGRKAVDDMVKAHHEDELKYAAGGTPDPDKLKPPSAFQVGEKAFFDAYDKEFPGNDKNLNDQSKWTPEIKARDAALGELVAIAAGKEEHTDWERDRVPRYEGLLAHEWKDKMAALEAEAEPPRPADAPASSKEKKSFEDVTSTFGSGKFDPAQAKKAGNLWDLFTKGTKGGSGNFPSYQERKGWLNTFAKNFVLKSGEIYKGTAAQNTRLLRAIKNWLFGPF